MIEITLGMNQSNQRLDKVLFKHLSAAPKSFVYKMLRKKNITLNGGKALGSEITVFGDSVQFYLSEETYEKMRGVKKVPDLSDISFPEIEILYEDDDVCIFVKPAGILSQKATQFDISVNEWVVVHARRSGLISDSDFESFRPSVVNRLDRNTSGIMCAGLSIRGLQELSAMFRGRTVEKYYYALVSGVISEKTDYRSWLWKDERTNKVRIYRNNLSGAQEIHTEAEPVCIYKDRTLLLVRLHTGKSHQIRAQLAAAGHPIIGDPKYGDPAVNRRYGLDQQCLHACRIVFPEGAGLPALSGKTIETEVPASWPLGTAED
ncbi:MAG: RluA family pseudouridine synthase [Lachnospiraceae bacterium]|nr:RluA family pseudouridine synthase [Lachnospiraceae bacterium]